MCYPGAPEYFRGEMDRSRQQCIKQAHPGKDIWALACIISEAAVWSVFGQRGLEEYRQRRSDATAAISTLKNTGYAGCFHDTTKVLAVVEDMHKEVIYRRRADVDSIVIPVLLTVGGMMNEDPTKRPDAWKVYDDLTRAIDQATLPAFSPTTQLSKASAYPQHVMHSDSVQSSGNVPNSEIDTLGDSSPGSSDTLKLDIGVSSSRSFSSSQAYAIRPIPHRRVRTNAELFYGSWVTGENDSLFYGSSALEGDDTPRQSRYGLAHRSGPRLGQNLMYGDMGPIPRSSAPLGPKALPVASIAEVLQHITKTKLNINTTLEGEEWLRRLHGRDQVCNQA